MVPRVIHDPPGLQEALDALDETDRICPRCAQPTTARFHGPCTQCRTELAANRLDITDTTEIDTAFVPAMHVVPNQVATKD